MQIANRKFGFEKDEMFYKVLVVDDEATSLASSRILLEGRGFRVELAESGERAVEVLKAAPHQFAVVVLDYHMKNGISGSETAQRILALKQKLYILMHSSDGAADTILSSWESGAVRFIGKNEDPEIFVSKVRKWYATFEEKNLPFVPSQGSSENAKLIASIGMVGESAAMAQVANQVKKFAARKDFVLITGETGAGKEQTARALHLGPDRSYLPLSAANLSAELLEAELFGHTEGSFTGATKDKIGLLESAEGGTVFLDEIWKLALPVQAKLLRALQEKKIRPVGASREYDVDFRLITAAKPDLPEMVRRGEFIRDLYERLRVLEIKVPPLRDRPEDIEPLIAHFCKLQEQKTGVKKTFQLRAVKAMKRYQWPGNVRELGNMVIRLFANVDEPIITLKHLEGQFEDPRLTDSPSTLPLKATTAAFEREKIINVLRNSSTIREAARKSGHTETTFRRMMRRHQIDSPTGAIDKH
jgi:DNA-binding NtrC family response regulator